jgi:hypothetical protein
MDVVTTAWICYFDCIRFDPVSLVYLFVKLSMIQSFNVFNDYAICVDTNT